MVNYTGVTDHREGKVKRFLLAGIAFGALVLPAAAADMPIKAPPPAPIDIWTGGYVGINGGYGWATDHIESIGSPGNCSAPGAGCSLPPVNIVSPTMAQAATFAASIDRTGGIYGGQAGHNWLLHNIFWNYDGVLGVEVDFQGVSDSHSTSLTTGAPITGFVNTVTSTTTLSEKIQTLGTLRGRAGWLWGPNTLIYGTAGLAFANAQTSVTMTQNLTGPVVGGAAGFPGSGYLNQELFGPTIGGGVEWKWSANLSIKAEYLYADLGNLVVNTQPSTINQVTTGLPFGQATTQTTSHVHENTARVGINYRFW
jgi:outer membrane immunogenic protein